MAAPAERASAYFVRDLERKYGSVLHISQLEIGDVGCVVWDAAIVLSMYLESPDFVTDSGDNILKGKTVLELGSGTGVVGIQAACLGAHTTITDLEEFAKLMYKNIDDNKHLVRGSIRAETLKWSTELISRDTKPDYLLLADCIYYQESLTPLVSTLDQLSGPDTTVLCCYEERLTGDKPEIERTFLQLVGRKFDIDEIPLTRHHPEYHSPDIHILKFTKFKQTDIESYNDDNLNY